ncbi:acyl-CoA carboxylase subunit epsilon [Nocardioides sp.]|uniref:acyl-CoA carboxylase subunit epsilon n=1 Tax=Nocardioides sp. TaxID=35761 RepID=UPI003D0FB4D1
MSEPPVVEPVDSVVEPVETPLLRVINPDATDEEIAALVAVFSALGSSPAPAPDRRTPAWQAHQRKLRVLPPAGPGGWRASGLPR